MSRVRGLELLFNLVKSQLKSRDDCLVAALHCLLINENLQCVGADADFTERDAQRATELLPQQWNENQEVYVLRYRSKDFSKRYLVKIVKAGDTLHISVALNDDVVGGMSANVKRHIAEVYDNYLDTYVELDSLVENFQKEIVDKVISPKQPGKVGVTTPTSNQPQQPNPDPLAVPRRPFVGGYQDPSAGQDFPSVGGRPFLPIGGQDLDPFGRGQGGMMLDPSDFGVPMRPNVPPFLPRGAVPPGARFDPFGPPGGPNRFRPNPDHFRRPDDMDDFM